MKLVLIDGNSLLFRAYFATAVTGNIMRAKDGTPTNAVFGFANLLNKILDDEKPTHLLVAFDAGKKTFRHEKYQDYKAGRPPLPEELKIQFSMIKDYLDARKVFHYEVEGYEADDIVGTTANLFSKDENNVVSIYSSDKDLLQLITDNVRVCLTRKGVTDLRIMTKETLFEDMGVTPTQIKDLKGLMGDSSDNLPGIPGVGDKTAVKLLQQYGSLEAVLEAGDIPGKLGEKIKANVEVARNCKELATIEQNMPIPYSFDELLYQEPDIEALRKFYLRYDMYSLVKKLPIVKELHLENVNYEIVSSLDELTLTMDSFIEVETVKRENYHIDEIIGLGIRIDSKNYFIEAKDLVNASSIVKYLENNGYKKSCIDSKRVIVLLNRLGIHIQNIDYDFLLASYLIDATISDDPVVLFNLYREDVAPLSSIIKKGEYDLNEVANYCLSKLTKVDRLKKKSLDKLNEINSLSLFNDIELPLAPILANMEITGIDLDTDLLKKKSDYIKVKINEISEQIYSLVGHEFNINSIQQLGEVLFDELKLPTNSKRSTAEKELLYLRQFHPIADLILKYRAMYKLVSTYLDGIPSYLLADNKIHTIYNQAVAETGRLSSSNPNLQNITVRTYEGREVRKAFVNKEPNSYLLSFDYSQIELRVMASLANVQSLIDAYNNDIDVHSLTASKLFDCNINEVTSTQRRQAKTVNFGVIYGMSDFGLADELGIGFKEAKEFINKYFETYPEIKEYSERVVEDCQNKGYVTTLFNRRRYIPQINDKNYNIREAGKRMAVNSPIQGTAADIIKLAMIKVDKLLKEHNFKTKMLLQIHDELVFSVPNNELSKVIPLIKHELEDFSCFKVKLVANYHYGYSWFEEE